MKKRAYFGPEFLRYLKQLKRNNDREWFQKNKPRYESELRDPALQFINDFSVPLEKISTHFLADARPSGGSLFRIYRDVRFSKDKSPYKTHVGIHLRHESAKDAHAPGFYLHLEPGGSFVGVGIWRPDGKTARKIRELIVENPVGWKKAAHRKAFRQEFDLAGDSLKRPPRGFDPDNPYIDDLKRKDFIGVKNLTDREIGSTDLLTSFSRSCRTAGPLMEFLARAIGIPY